MTSAQATRLKALEKRRVPLRWAHVSVTTNEAGEYVDIHSGEPVDVQGYDDITVLEFVDGPHEQVSGRDQVPGRIRFDSAARYV